MGNDGYYRLKSALERSLSETAVTGSMSGLPAVGAEDQTRTMAAMKRVTPISLLLVLFVLRLLEPRLSGLAAVAIPLLLAIGATVGLVGMLTGSLTIMETFFGVTVLGLGIDFAIHLIARQREERASGASLETALPATLTHCGAGVVAGAATTAGAFLIVGLAPDPVARHLGLSGGIGLLCCLLLMLTMLPAAWVLIERRRSKHGGLPQEARSGGPKRSETSRMLLALTWLTRRAVARPRLVLALSALAAVFALSGAPRLRMGNGSHEGLQPQRAGASNRRASAGAVRLERRPLDRRRQ